MVLCQLSIFVTFEKFVTGPTDLGLEKASDREAFTYQKAICTHLSRSEYSHGMSIVDPFDLEASALKRGKNLKERF